MLKVRSRENGRFVNVEVTDRRANKKLYKESSIIDLSKRAFSEIASLEQGLAKIKIEVVE